MRYCLRDSAAAPLFLQLHSARARVQRLRQHHRARHGVRSAEAKSINRARSSHGASRIRPQLSELSSARKGPRLDVPWVDLTDEERHCIEDVTTPSGIRGFFRCLERKNYNSTPVFLSRYRAIARVPIATAPAWRRPRVRGGGQTIGRVSALRSGGTTVLADLPLSEKDAAWPTRSCERFAAAVLLGESV